MKKPKVIFLDAVGTLFGVRGSVGEVYSAIAREFGVDVPADALNLAFYQSFKEAGLPVFDASPEDIPGCEHEWWEAIAFFTFERVDASQQFSDFPAFFDKLYAHFATSEPWILYPDVRSSLEKWRSLGITLGIISNFDTRIYSVLKALELEDFFTSVTISSEAIAAKPDPKIFSKALEKHNCAPQEAWHIGDSLKEDYQGAKAAGLRGILIKRT